MEILFLLIPISLLLAGGGLVSCIWAIRAGQFNDLESPAQRLVFEDRLEIQRAPEPGKDKTPPIANSRSGNR